MIASFFKPRFLIKFSTNNKCLLTDMLFFHLQLLFILLMLTLPQLALGQAYTIEGDLQGLPDRTQIFLIKYSSTEGNFDTTNVVLSLNGKFIIKSIYKDEGEVNFVKIDTSTIKLSKDKRSDIVVIVDSKNITLSGKLDEWPKVKINGSIATNDYFTVVDTILRLNKVELQRNKRNKLTTFSTASNGYGDDIIKIFMNYRNSLATPAIAVKFTTILPLEKLDALYDSWSNRVKNSQHGKIINRYIIRSKRAGALKIGIKIPNFEVKTPQGQLTNIHDILKNTTNGRLTLVDFWAWWCAPCRADIPNLKKVYNSFQNKGFNILSISTDPNISKWKQALKEEETPWTNVMQEGNPSKDIFGLVAIPAYILLNEKAEIVAMDINSILSKQLGTLNGKPVYSEDKLSKSLRGDSLYAVIEELLGKNN